MRILGISAFYHDSAAALIEDGRIVAAVQEERFSRKKFDAEFPTQSINYCLGQSGIELDKVDFVVFYEKPFLKFERLLETYLAFAPRGFGSFKSAIPIWIKEKLFQKDLLRKELQRIEPRFDWETRLLFAEHHLSHAASAFFPSPFEDAAVVTLDGVGEWTTSSQAIGTGNRLEIHKELHFPHSIGLLYSAFTYYLGFRVNSGEYKVMGLAPYGEPRYAALILEKLVDLKDDGSFRLDMSYFDYCTGLTMTNDAFSALFGLPPRNPERDPLLQFHMDMASSIQAVVEEMIMRICRAVARESGARNLCLAGGVALNCVANGKLLRENIFERLWIQPASGDAGGALGAALAGYFIFANQRRIPDERDGMQGSYLGPVYSQADVEYRLDCIGAKYEVLEDDHLFDATAHALSSDKAVAWMQGRMEFGPRALGARSILADPRSPHIQRTLNTKVKYRESFRPFAPSVLREDVSEWFDLNCDSPYMQLVTQVREHHCRAMSPDEKMLFGIDKLNVVRSAIPAVTHVDYSARVQTVHAETNPRYHALIARFKQLTGCGVLVNTSFNVRGEPIVCSPEDAFRCFMGSEIDVLVVGNCFLRKEFQDSALKVDYRNSLDLD